MSDDRTPLDPTQRDGKWELPVVDQLAQVYRDRDEAILLVARAGFPKERIPDFQRPQVFWAKVAEDARAGAFHGGIRAIVEQALRTHPANPVFADFVSRPSPQTELRQLEPSETKAQGSGGAILASPLQEQPIGSAEGRIRQIIREPPVGITLWSLFMMLLGLGIGTMLASTWRGRGLDPAHGVDAASGGHAETGQLHESHDVTRSGPASPAPALEGTSDQATTSEQNPIRAPWRGEVAPDGLRIDFTDRMEGVRTCLDSFSTLKDSVIEDETREDWLQTVKHHENDCQVLLSALRTL